jgi:hypothetical protein
MSLLRGLANMTLDQFCKRTPGRRRPKIVGLVPQPFLLFSRPFVVDREPRVGAGKRFPFAFDGCSDEVMHKAASKDFAAPDISALVLTFPKRVVEVPIRRLHTFVEQSDLVQRRSPDHDAGAVEPVEHDRRETSIDMAAERFPIAIHGANLVIELGRRFP